MALRLRCGDVEKVVAVEKREGGYRVTVGERAYEVRARGENGSLWLDIGGRPLAAAVARDGDRLLVHLGGESWELCRVTAAARRAHGPGVREDRLSAPMPGQVRAIHVSEGQSVARSETLLVLEAMKMEFRIRAPRDGRVARLGCRVGDVVERGQVLVELEEAA
jgi:acetyl/propionyl-CoA carboxylase alpha subunit